MILLLFRNPACQVLTSAWRSGFGNTATRTASSRLRFAYPKTVRETSSMIHKGKLVTTLLAVIMTSAVAVAQEPAGDIVAEAEGYGLSKKDALLKAKRDAVETGIGTVLISQTEIRNYELQKDVILTKTVGAVKSYDILSREKQSDGSYYVRIRAIVSLADIREDLAALKILLESMDKPRMMVVIAEEKGKEAENAIVDYLAAKGFDLVDPAVTAALMQKQDRLISRAAAGDPAAAAKIGAANGAEYILVGRVEKSVADSAILRQSGMVSGQATISAKVVNCSNGRIIASKSERSAAAHIAEDVAMNTASGKVGRKLMDTAMFETIVASFQDMVNNGNPLEVTVRDVDTYQLQKDVQMRIGELSDPVSISKRSFGNGELALTVMYKGNADSFCDRIEGQSIGSRKFAVTAIEGSRVVVRLK
jgi:hypothetical protein